jgi:uncharacterized membrane protein
MKILKIIATAIGLLLVLAIGAFVVAGIALPAEVEFVNEVEINAPAEPVWQVVTDKSKYTEWQTNLARVELVDDKNWIEYPKDFPEPLRFTLVKDERPSSVEIKYTIGDTVEGSWKGSATPTANGIRLRTTDGYKANGWMTKILLRAFFDLDTFAKDWNNKLKARAEKVNN